MKNWLKAFLQAAGVIAGTLCVFVGAFLLDGYINFPGDLIYLVAYLPNIVALFVIRQTDERIRLVAVEILMWIPLACALAFLFESLLTFALGILVIVYQLLPLGVFLYGLLLYIWIKKRRCSNRI